jgi:dihydroorotase
MAYDLLLKNATVIDPSQGLEGGFDVAIQDGKIAALSASITEPAQQTIDLSGKVLTPGWIDIHAHVFAGATTWGIHADALCLATGVTTVVDAGSPGWANFLAFHDHIAAPARTQILTFVHISGIGLTYGPVGEMLDMDYADPDRTAYTIHSYPEVCVGVKVRLATRLVGENGVEPLRQAVKAAEMVDTPVMVHMGAGVTVADTLAELRSGDIVTHCYRGDGDATLGDTILDAQGNIRAEVQKARQQGILFDVGHGGGSFLFETAKKALSQNFLPDVISTDIHTGSFNDPVYGLPETASKLLNLGISLPDIVNQTTTAAAKSIGRENELGTLRVGTVADLAAYEIQEGEFRFHDVRDNLEIGQKNIQPFLTVRAGKVYRPVDVQEELDENLKCANHMRAIVSRRFDKLGWSPKTC